MWTGLIGNRIIGPVELPTPLTAQDYLHFLQHTLPGLLNVHLTREQQNNMIFMHDGAPAHTAAIVRNHLDQVIINLFVALRDLHARL